MSIGATCNPLTLGSGIALPVSKWCMISRNFLMLNW